MAKLKNTIAVETGYLKMLEKNGSQVLENAKEVTEAIEAYTRQVNRAIDQLPAEVKRTGTQGAIAEAGKKADPNLYSSAKSSMRKTLKKMMEEVPKYDKTCGDTAEKLIAVTKNLTNRITSLENMVVSGSITFDDNTFQEQLEQCKEDWNREAESLAEILKAIKAALKGVQDEACRYSKDPVNLSTGNFIYDRKDLKIGGVVPLSFHRYYNSLDERNGVMGEKWKHNYEICLLFEKDHVTVLKEDGKEESFQKDGDGYAGITGSIHTIKETETGYCYEEKQGAVYIFDQQGKLLELSDINGNRTLFTYDRNNRLTRAESLSGYLTYHYNQQGKLEEVTDHTGRKVTMDYEEGRLCKVTTPMKVHYRYTYGADGNLKSIINPQGVETVQNRFDGKGRTKKQNFPDGGRMRFSYDDNSRMVVLKERNGAQILYEHDVRYRNVRTIYPDGEETWTYNRNSQRTSYTDKNGNRTVYTYDNRGNLTAVVDACGNATRIIYGEQEKPVCIRTPDGGEFRYIYDEKGNLTKQVDACGNVTEVQYNDMGRPVKVIQADQTETTLLYDERGNVTVVIRPDGGQTAYTYDDLNRVIQTTDEDGDETYYSYDDNDRITAVTNAEGNTRTYTYNVSGLVTEIVDYDGSKTTRGYNALNKLEWETDKEGNTTRYAYDRMWNVSHVILPNTGEVLYQYNELEQLECVTNPLGGELFYHYDKNGNMIQIENANGDAITYTYDEMNRRISTTDALGNESRTYYDAMGRVIREVDALGRTFDTVYDGNGNKTAETNPVNGGMTYTYDCMRRIETMTDGAGRVRKYTYDVCGRVQELEDFDGRKECYLYDRKGNMTCKKDSAGKEYHYAYDSMNRVIEVREKENVLQSYTYDASGNRTSVTDAGGSRTEYHYTPNGHMDQVTDPAGNVTSYFYDAMGQLEKIMYPSEREERVTAYERNLAGQVTKVTDALGNTETYEYDCYGRMTGKTDRNGQYTGFGHNAMGDITHIRYADEKEVYLSYDPLRQLKELQDWTGTTQFRKDEAGRTREITDASGNTVAYEWGTMGERTGIIYPDGQKAIYEYDRYLNLREVTAGKDQTVYAYDENGRLSEKRYANGMRSCYTYTPEGRLESLLHEDGDGMLDRFLYTYDAVGNRITEERERRNLPDENGSYRYHYDMLGRLTAVEKDGEIKNSYEYDAYGNRITERKKGEEIRYLYNEGNQLVKRETGSEIQDYIYDGNGNLLQIMQNGEVTAKYQYDSTGSMVFAETKQGSAEYEYNGFGKKVSMKLQQPETGMSGSGTAGETDYVLDYTRDYNNLLQRKTGGRTETYFWDDNLLSAVFATEDALLHQGDSSRNMTYLLDPFGSPLHFCNAEGIIEKSYGYDAFGEDLDTQGYNMAAQSIDRMQPFGFTGYERDVVSGLYYAQARRYDAETGRFTSRDMIKGNISQMQSQNEYAYCLGNPLAYVDRDGREQQLVSGDDYRFVGYDENGFAIITKDNGNIEIGDVDVLDQTYDWTVTGLGVLNETNNIYMPRYIKEQPRPNNIGKGVWDKKVASELAEQSSFYSKAGKVLENAEYVGVLVDVGVGVYNNRQAGTGWKRTLSDAEVDLHFSLFNLGASTAAGAAIGSLTYPIVGTIAGIIIGLFLDFLLCEMEINGDTVSGWLKESNWESKNIPNLVKDKQKH